MSIALRGNLADFGIGEVFQLIGQQRKTGVLEVSNDRGRIQLRFDSGAVVAAAPVGEQPDAALGEMLVRRGLVPPDELESALAECAASLERLGLRLVERGLVSRADVDETEEFLTTETLFDLLRENSGSFHFTAQPVPHERDRAKLLGAEEILMEGLRKVDEWRTLAKDLPPEDAVLRRRRSFDSYAASASGEARRRLVTAERVYLLVDGRLPLRRVIDLSHLGTFEGSRIVAELLAAGVVEPVRRRRERARQARVEGSLAPGAWISGAIVLGILLAVAVVLQVAGRPAAAGARVAGDGLAPIEASLAARRVRNALDAYRAGRGVWPERLEEIADAGFLDRDALTSPSGAPYYYRRSDDGVVLLAPER